MAGSMEKFAIKFRVYTKVITVDEYCDLLDDIKNAYRAVAEFPSHFLVKYESKDLGYVDLDEPTDLEDRKTNILLVEELPGGNAPPSDSFELEDNSINRNLETSLQNENSPPKESWPHPFLIKDYMIRQTVREKLDGKNVPVFLSDTERTSIFMSLYDECAKYNNRYPSGVQYREMINALFKRFPCLSQESLSYEDTANLWRERLKNHFKRQRSNIKTDDPEILQKRQKYGKRKIALCDNASPPAKKKSSLCWGVVNFLPQIEEGEDQVTIEHYQREMSAQLKHTKERRDLNKIDNLMVKTFPHRRKLLIKELIRLKELVEIYPLICDGEQVLAEFQRITGWSLEDRLKFSLKKYGSFIVSNKSTTEKDSLVELKLKCSSTKSEEERQYYMMCIALLSIPFQFRETPFTYFDITAEQSDQPRYQPRLLSESFKSAEDISNIFDATFKVVVEDFVVAETGDFLKAMLYVIASYYVFNTEYPKENAATLIFIQKFLLNITDKSKTPEKVCKYIGLLKKGTFGL